MSRPPRPLLVARTLPLVLASLAAACASPLELEEGPSDALVLAVARAQGVAELRAHEALSCRVRYSFADVEYAGRLWVDCRRGRSRLELEGGGLLIDDGEQRWCSPADLALPNPAFHAVLAARLIRLPAELEDEAARVRRGPPVRIAGQALETLRLARPEGRDPLADELVVHVDPRTARIALVGLVARAADGGPVSSAASPHDWVDLEGFLVPTTWKGHLWSPRHGLGEGTIAVLALDDPTFVRARPGAFTPPRGARRL